MRVAVAVSLGVAGSADRRCLGCAIGSAAPFGAAVFNALEQASRVGRSSHICGTIKRKLRGFALELLGLEAELGLDGCAVDAVAMEALTRSLGQLHVLCARVGVEREGDLQMHAGDDLGVGELPDVDVVAADDAGKMLNVLSDLADADVFGSRLEKNARGGTGKRNRRVENNSSNKERNGGVSILLAGPLGKPDDESSGNDADVTKGITNNVEEHGVHAHVTVVVAALLSRLLG